MYLNAILQFHLSHKWIRLNSCQLLHLSTQLDNTKLGQPITKQCLIVFSLWCKNVTLAVQEKTLFIDTFLSILLVVHSMKNFGVSYVTV